jgi:LTXXQ motif family protein
MIAAVEIVQPSLEKFYGLLSDEQKLRLTALGQDQRQSKAVQKTATSLAQTCGAAQPGATAWPTAEIDRTVHPTEAQRASLVTLEEDTTKAADMLKASCQPDNSLTPPARLASVGKRLDTILQAVKTVRAGLDGFYGSLSDEQKASFEVIGSRRTSDSDPATARQVHYCGRNIEGDAQSLIRHLLPF